MAGMAVGAVLWARSTACVVFRSGTSFSSRLSKKATAPIGVAYKNTVCSACEYPAT